MDNGEYPFFNIRETLNGAGMMVLVICAADEAARAGGRGPGRVFLLFFQQPIQPSENGSIARFPGLGCY